MVSDLANSDIEHMNFLKDPYTVMRIYAKRQMNFYKFKLDFPCSLATGSPYTSLPIDGGGLGWGWLQRFIFTLPLIPSRQGRGDF